MSGNIGKKAASGMVWTAIQKYSQMFIQFLSGIILARLLTPFDYGCIGMLSIFMVVAEAFIEGGFGSAIIQKKNPSQEDYSTIFYWNLGMATFMYGVLFFSAPAISRFYRIPVLSDVLRVQGVILFIYAFNVIQRSQLRKKLQFKIISIVTLVTSIIAFCVTLVMAFKGCGVWALVVQHLISAAIPTIVFWVYSKWRPKAVFSWASFKELFSFGAYMFLTHIIDKIGTQIQGLLIGKVYNPATMGYYSKALSTERLASTSISQVMTQVTFPIYAEVQDDKKRMTQMVKRLVTSLAYVTFPMMFILLLLAKPLFVLLYSDKWLQSVPYFQILCIAGLAYCLQSVNLQTISAIGKSRTMFFWTLLKRSVGIGFIVGGLWLFGMDGLLWGTVLNTWFSLFVNMGLVSKHIGYRLHKQLLDLFPILLVSSIAAIVCFFIGKYIHGSMYLIGSIQAIVYLIIYMGWSIVIKPEAFLNFRKAFGLVFSKIKK